VALKNIAEDKDWRGSISGMSLSEGWCDVTVQDSTADSTLTGNQLRLIGTGYSYDISHTAWVVIEGEDKVPQMPGAVAVDAADTSAFNFAGSSFIIDGNDTNRDGTPGTAAPVYGLTTSDVEDSTRCADEPKSFRITGLGDPPSIGLHGEIPSLDTLAMALEPRANNLPGGKYTSETWGTFESPEITYIHDDVEIAGNTTGAGILLINGDLKLAGTFYWEGLVFIFGENLTIDWTVGTPYILGGLVLQSETAFFDMRGNVDIIYSSQTIGNVHENLDVVFYELICWYE
jgi:hypothetical protein